MRCVTLIAISIVAAASALATEHPANLVGRWRSDDMPVGYWIIDRYPDGRLAKKLYTRDYSHQPAEIAATWGRWRVRGTKYQEFFESATSKNSRAYVGKWWSMRIQQISAMQFDHLSCDGHDTFENRFYDDRPLLEVQQPPAKDYRWNKIIDTITPSRTAIPSWVNSVALPPST